VHGHPRQVVVGFDLEGIHDDTPLVPGQECTATLRPPGSSVSKSHSPARAFRLDKQPAPRSIATD
jgi:hypothetical protein